MKKKIFLFLQLLFSILLLFLIISKYNISLLKIKFSNPGWVLLSLILSIFVIPVLAAFRWKIFLKYSGIAENIISLLKINFISIFWGIFLPTSDGFGAIRMIQIENRHSEKTGISGSSIVLEKIFGFISLCFLGLIGSYVLGDFKSMRLTRIILLVMMLFSIFILLSISNKKFSNLLLPFFERIKIFRKVVDYLIRMHSSLTIFPYKKAVFRVFPIIFIFQILTFLNVLFLFRAMNINIPVFYHLAAVPIIQLISLIPLSISGLGIRESAFVFFYGLLGIDPANSFQVSILNFLIMTGIPAFIGGLISIFPKIRKIIFAGNTPKFSETSKIGKNKNFL